MKSYIFKGLKDLIELNGETTLYSDSTCAHDVGRGYEGLSGLNYIVEYDNPGEIQVFKGSKEIMIINKDSDLFIIINDLKWLGFIQ
ncbi:MAG: hypothetical protein RSG52_15145 [Terrisporobacter sp.]|uniref:hypothetical protein n=1 Tax=Terrisporobacter sp. TaxID=1965305 RepID=UPI002FC8BB63